VTNDPTGGRDPSAAPAEIATRLLAHLDGWAASTLLAIGLRLGLVDAILTQPGTSSDLAERASVTEPNTQQWLASMLAAGYLTHHHGVYAARDGLREVLQPNALDVDLRACLELPLLAPRLHDQLLEAMREGRGITYQAHRAVFGRLTDRLNRPLLVRYLLQEWLPAVPGLVERLRDGAHLVEPGCGTGTAAILLARAFPAARILGLDTDPEALTVAGRRAAHLGLDNLAFRCADALQEDLAEPADAILVINLLHDLPDAPAAVRLLAHQLNENGLLVAVEADAAGDIDDDAKRTAVLAYHSRLTHCVQVSLAAGGSGPGPLWGTPCLLEALNAADLTHLGSYRSKTGRVIAWGTRGGKGVNGSP